MMTWIVDSVWTNAMASATDIMTGPVGLIIAFVVWIALIGLAVWVFKRFI